MCIRDSQDAFTWPFSVRPALTFAAASIITLISRGRDLLTKTGFQYCSHRFIVRRLRSRVIGYQLKPSHALFSRFGSSGSRSGTLERARGGCSSCCLLYTSPSPRDRTRSRMPSSA
eukprot:TRINITY_DN7424_c0_g1_i1.p1 TRINITY_DN7424_c0_g1~~TRINITY_DN7424_c0_g1_i1.p1  ORF type:complete len:116 (+),score=22.12 TRINITY_DN7424_c0_g1_i1:80-427(+)